MRLIAALLLAGAPFVVVAQPPPVPGSPTSGTAAKKEDPWFTKKGKKPDNSIRNLTGTVYDSKNNRVAGAVVRLTDTESGEGQEAVTLKEAVAPAVTVTLAGWLVMAGAVAVPVQAAPTLMPWKAFQTAASSAEPAP